jgi:hypothetical protein
VNVPCFVWHSRAQKESKVLAETRDISRGGACLVVRAGWEVGTEIECELKLLVDPPPKKPVEIRCRGKIVWVAQREFGDMEMGLSIEEFWNPQPLEE